MKPRENLMVELETMGMGSCAAIVAIGAVFCNPATGETGAAFYQAVDLSSSMSAGGTVNGETIKWWLCQSNEARATIAKKSLPLIDNVLRELHFWARENAQERMDCLKVWGKGANFVLRGAYERSQLTPFWHVGNDRDVHTIIDMGINLGINVQNDLSIDQARDNALNCALYQVHHVANIWQKIIQHEE